MEHLTPAQRTELRRSLEDKRDRATARAAVLEADWNEIVTASAEAVRDDEHDPEGATIAFERAQVAALLADARAQRADAERTLSRLERGEAGRCVGCGGPIGIERLQARPTATRCMCCAG